MAVNPLTVQQASQMVLAHCFPAPAAVVSLQDALGLCLAADICTSSDSPRFDKAMMDGFAVSTQAVSTQTGSIAAVAEAGAGQQIEFDVIDTATAGQASSHSVGPRTAVRIMTGAQLPVGADCVVPIEQTSFSEATPDKVTIPARMIQQEYCIVRQGGIVKAGVELIRAGTVIQPPQIAAMAEFGYANVLVYRRPTVAVLATGNELVDIDQTPTHSQIRNSNAPMLQAQIRQCTADPINLGIARDQVSDLASHIQRGLQSNILLLTGGVSAGMLDLVPSQLKAAGVQQIFHGVLMKPGKPLWFGIYEHAGHRCLVFGLPGNPVSSLVCFELFVRIAINRLLGHAEPIPRPFSGTLTESIAVKGNRPVYHPAAVRLLPEGLVAKPVAWSGSSDLRATVEANGMILLVPTADGHAAGATVDIFLWSDSLLLRP